MNRPSLLLTLSLFVGTILTVHAQMARPHSLSIDATPTSVGGSTETTLGTKTSSRASNSRTSSGFTHTLNTNRTETKTSKQAIQVSVRNFGVMPDTAHIEWYFIASPISLDPDKPSAEQQFAFDQGAKDINIAGNGTETFAVESQEVTSTVQRNNRSRMGRSGKIGNGRGTSVKEGGNKLAGWVVRVVADGRVVASKGSSSTLEDLAKDDKKFQEFISE